MKCRAYRHFAACYDKKNKKLSPNSKEGINPANNWKAYQVAKEPLGEIILSIGGVQQDGVLIDSGASCNQAYYNTWNNLKHSYLPDRKYCVNLGGHVNTCRTVSRGCP